MIRENCYVLSDETGEAAIVDCGAWYPEERKALTDYIAREKLKPVLLVATHGHLDHNMGNKTPYEAYGLQPMVSSSDNNLITHLPEQAVQLIGEKIDNDFPPVKGFIEDGDKLHFGSHTLEIMDTPGHTKGSVCLYCREENVLLSGDTLFKGSIGRTDLKGGSMFLMTSSLRRIAQLPDETRVLPGHGDATTIGYELAHNPYMDR